MSKPTDRAFPRLSRSQLLISLAMFTILFLAMTVEGGMKPASSFSDTSDCLIGTSFPISQESGRQEVPAIAYNSQNNEYLAVWQSKEASDYWNICGQVVLDTGDVPDERKFCTLASADQQFPALAYNSNNCQYLVVWQDARNFSPYGWDIYGQLISCTGELMGDAFRLVGRGKDQRHPAVAYNSEADEYLVVWQDRWCRSLPYYTADDIYGWRVDSGGSLIGDVIPISIATDCKSDKSVQQSPVVAYNSQDNQYLVVWEDDRNGNWDICGQLLSAAGEPLGDNFPIVMIQEDQRSPDLAYNSQDNLYLVVWQDNYYGDWDIYGVRVWSDGTGGIVFPISSSPGSEKKPAVAHNSQDNEYLVVWQDRRNGDDDIYGQRVGSNDSLLGDECPISTVANDQESPDVAYNSQNNEYLVVWQDERNGEDNDDIYGQRVRSAPTPTPTSTPTLTPTHTPTVTPTPTPTSIPGPPALIQPADDAVLPQPVSPNEWYFSWDARRGPCLCAIYIRGPGGRHLGDNYVPWQEGYEYRYTTDEYLPDDALGPWYWGVSVHCPLANNYSETRIFWVEQAPTRVYLPLLMYFNVYNDGWGYSRTWMYLDDVSVEVCY